MAKRVTIRDIAEEVGLSMTAVSLVLSGRPNKISSSSRQLILDTASRMNYRRVHTQQGESKGNSQTIMQIIPDISNSFFSSMVLGVDSITYANGYNIILSSSHNDSRREMQTLNSIYSASVDGVLVTTSARADSRLYADLFARLNLPIVLVDRILPTLPYSSLTFNHKKGAYLATKYLLDLGHRKIACLSGGKSEYSSVSQRISGYRWAMEDAGLAVAEEDILSGDYTDQSGYALADQIFKSGFSAVFCCNDMMAYGLYKRANERGVRIPEDLSVVGFDDNEFSNLISPPLTTVRQSAYDLGQEAAKRLLMEIRDPSLQRQSIYFEPSLIVRSSACPAEPAQD